MSYALVFSVAFLASWLTFFSGFGLGTLLLPALALFFPIERAIALTAVVHFLNGLFKLVLVARFADLRIVLLFGLPAIVAAAAGAWLLLRLSEVPPIVTYSLLGTTRQITWAKLLVGLLLIAFGLAEVLPSLRRMTFGREYLPIGGVLSGFFGGLSGMQGALRSAFLARADLSKEAFVATGAVVASLIDVSRLGVYWRALVKEAADIDYVLLLGAVLSAFAGAAIGSRLLARVTMVGIRRVVAVMLFAVALGLGAGIL
jgi:uncharacterized membrane protein YfcA